MSALAAPTNGHPSVLILLESDVSEKTNWPCCPLCKKNHPNLDAFEGCRFGWHTETCECGNTYQIRFTEELQFETRQLSADRTMPHHFALPADHIGQEL